MAAIVNRHSTLFLNLVGTAAKGTQRLIDAGFYDSAAEGPCVAEIEKEIAPFISSEKNTPIPNQALAWIIDYEAIQVGTAFQALGNLDIALLWYQIGQYYWRGQGHWYTGDLLDLEWEERESPALIQEDAGTCSALSDHENRAIQLFSWAAQNYYKTDVEIHQNEQERQYRRLWDSIGFQVYALLWLGDQWSEVARLSDIGLRALEKTRKAGHPKDFRTPQLLIELGQLISAYFIDPNDANREMARSALRHEHIHGPDDHLRADMLRYYFALSKRFPAISPYRESEFHEKLWRPSNEKRASPPTRPEIREALEEMLSQAAQAKKPYLPVSSYQLHLRIGGYPGPDHRLELCCEIMRERLKTGGSLRGQSTDPKEGYLEISFPTRRR